MNDTREHLGDLTVWMESSIRERLDEMSSLLTSLRDNPHDVLSATYAVDVGSMLNAIEQMYDLLHLDPGSLMECPGCLAHDLRTPLTATIGFSQLMLEFRSAYGDEAPSPIQAQVVRRVYEHSEWLLMLVNNVADYAKLKSGQMKFFIKPEQHTLQDHFSWFSQTHPNLLVDAPENPACITSDGNRIQQILQAIWLSVMAVCDTPKVRSHIYPVGRFYETRLVFETAAPVAGVLTAPIDAYWSAATDRLEIWELGLHVAAALVAAHDGMLQIHTESDHLAIVIQFPIPR